MDDLEQAWTCAPDLPALQWPDLTILFLPEAPSGSPRAYFEETADRLGRGTVEKALGSTALVLEPEGDQPAEVDVVMGDTHIVLIGRGATTGPTCSRSPSRWHPCTRRRVQPASSSTRLNGVSAAIRTRVNPPARHLAPAGPGRPGRRGPARHRLDWDGACRSASTPRRTPGRPGSGSRPPVARRRLDQQHDAVRRQRGRACRSAPTGSPMSCRQSKKHTRSYPPPGTVGRGHLEGGPVGHPGLRGRAPAPARSTPGGSRSRRTATPGTPRPSGWWTRRGRSRRRPPGHPSERVDRPVQGRQPLVDQRGRVPGPEEPLGPAEQAVVVPVPADPLPDRNASRDPPRASSAPGPVEAADDERRAGLVGERLACSGVSDQVGPRSRRGRSRTRRPPGRTATRGRCARPCRSRRPGLGVGRPSSARPGTGRAGRRSRPARRSARRRSRRRPARPDPEPVGIDAAASWFPPWRGRSGGGRLCVRLSSAGVAGSPAPPLQSACKSARHADGMVEAGMTKQERPWTSDNPRVAGTLEELVAGATEREPVRTADARSGASFERLRIDGAPYFLKVLSADEDWIMRVTGNTTHWEWQVWQAGLYATYPPRSTTPWSHGARLTGPAPQLAMLMTTAARTWSRPATPRYRLPSTTVRRPHGRHARRDPGLARHLGLRAGPPVPLLRAREHRPRARRPDVPGPIRVADEGWGLLPAAPGPGRPGPGGPRRPAALAEALRHHTRPSSPATGNSATSAPAGRPDDRARLGLPG